MLKVWIPEHCYPKRRDACIDDARCRTNPPCYYIGNTNCVCGKLLVLRWSEDICEVILTLEVVSVVEA